MSRGRHYRHAAITRRKWQLPHFGQRKKNMFLKCVIEVNLNVKCKWDNEGKSFRCFTPFFQLTLTGVKGARNIYIRRAWCFFSLPFQRDEASRDLSLWMDDWSDIIKTKTWGRKADTATEAQSPSPRRQSVREEWEGFMDGGSLWQRHIGRSALLTQTRRWVFQHYNSYLTNCPFPKLHECHSAIARKPVNQGG